MSNELDSLNEGLKIDGQHDIDTNEVSGRTYRLDVSGAELDTEQGQQQKEWSQRLVGQPVKVVPHEIDFTGVRTVASEKMVTPHGEVDVGRLQLLLNQANYDEAFKDYDTVKEKEMKLAYSRLPWTGSQGIDTIENIKNRVVENPEKVDITEGLKSTPDRGMITMSNHDLNRAENLLRGLKESDQNYTDGKISKDEWGNQIGYVMTGEREELVHKYMLIKNKGGSTPAQKEVELNRPVGHPQFRKAKDNGGWSEEGIISLLTGSIPDEFSGEAANAYDLNILAQGNMLDMKLTARRDKSKIPNLDLHSMMTGLPQGVQEHVLDLQEKYGDQYAVATVFDHRTDEKVAKELGKHSGLENFWLMTAGMLMQPGNYALGELVGAEIAGMKMVSSGVGKQIVAKSSLAASTKAGFDVTVKGSGKVGEYGLKALGGAGSGGMFMAQAGLPKQFAGDASRPEDMYGLIAGGVVLGAVLNPVAHAIGKHFELRAEKRKVTEENIALGNAVAEMSPENKLLNAQKARFNALRAVDELTRDEASELGALDKEINIRMGNPWKPISLNDYTAKNGLKIKGDVVEPKVEVDTIDPTYIDLKTGYKVPVDNVTGKLLTKRLKEEEAKHESWTDDSFKIPEPFADELTEIMNTHAPINMREGIQIPKEEINLHPVDEKTEVVEEVIESAEEAKKATETVHKEEESTVVRTLDVESMKEDSSIKGIEDDLSSYYETHGEDPHLKAIRGQIDEINTEAKALWEKGGEEQNPQIRAEWESLMEKKRKLEREHTKFKQGLYDEEKVKQDTWKDDPKVKAEERLPYHELPEGGIDVWELHTTPEGANPHYKTNDSPKIRKAINKINMDEPGVEAQAAKITSDNNLGGYRIIKKRKFQKSETLTDRVRKHAGGIKDLLSMLKDEKKNGLWNKLIDLLLKKDWEGTTLNIGGLGDKASHNGNATDTHMNIWDKALNEGDGSIRATVTHEGLHMATRKALREGKFKDELTDLWNKTLEFLKSDKHDYTEPSVNDMIRVLQVPDELLIHALTNTKAMRLLVMIEEKNPKFWSDIGKESKGQYGYENSVLSELRGIAEELVTGESRRLEHKQEIVDELNPPNWEYGEYGVYDEAKPAVEEEITWEEFEGIDREGAGPEFVKQEPEEFDYSVYDRTVKWSIEKEGIEDKDALWQRDPDSIPEKATPVTITTDDFGPSVWFYPYEVNPIVADRTPLEKILAKLNWMNHTYSNGVIAGDVSKMGVHLQELNNRVARVLDSQPTEEEIGKLWKSFYGVTENRVITPQTSLNLNSSSLQTKDLNDWLRQYNENQNKHLEKGEPRIELPKSKTRQELIDETGWFFSMRLDYEAQLSPEELLQFTPKRGIEENDFMTIIREMRSVEKEIENNQKLKDLRNVLQLPHVIVNESMPENEILAQLAVDGMRRDEQAARLTQIIDRADKVNSEQQKALEQLAGVFVDKINTIERLEELRDKLELQVNTTSANVDEDAVKELRLVNDQLERIRENKKTIRFGEKDKVKTSSEIAAEMHPGEMSPEVKKWHDIGMTAGMANAGKKIEKTKGYEGYQEILDELTREGTPRTYENIKALIEEKKVKAGQIVTKSHKELLADVKTNVLQEMGLESVPEKWERKERVKVLSDVKQRRKGSARTDSVGTHDNWKYAEENGKKLSTFDEASAKVQKAKYEKKGYEVELEPVKVKSLTGELDRFKIKIKRKDVTKIEKNIVPVSDLEKKWKSIYKAEAAQKVEIESFPKWLEHGLDSKDVKWENPEYLKFIEKYNEGKKKLPKRSRDDINKTHDINTSKMNELNKVGQMPVKDLDKTPDLTSEARDKGYSEHDDKANIGHDSAEKWLDDNQSRVEREINYRDDTGNWSRLKTNREVYDDEYMRKWFDDNADIPDVMQLQKDWGDESITVLQPLNVSTKTSIMKAQTAEEYIEAMQAWNRVAEHRFAETKGTMSGEDPVLKELSKMTKQQKLDYYQKVKMGKQVDGYKPIDLVIESEQLSLKTRAEKLKKMAAEKIVSEKYRGGKINEVDPDLILDELGRQEELLKYSQEMKEGERGFEQTVAREKETQNVVAQLNKIKEQLNKGPVQDEEVYKVIKDWEEELKAQHALEPKPISTPGLKADTKTVKNSDASLRPTESEVQNFLRRAEEVTPSGIPIESTISRMLKGQENGMMKRAVQEMLNEEFLNLNKYAKAKEEFEISLVKRTKNTIEFLKRYRAREVENLKANNSVLPPCQ